MHSDVQCFVNPFGALSEIKGSLTPDALGCFTARGKVAYTKDVREPASSYYASLATQDRTLIGVMVKHHCRQIL